MIAAFVLIEADADRIAELGPELAALEGVSEAHSVAGSDVDLVAIVRVPTHEDVATAVTQRISKLPGVRATRTLISFRAHSEAQLDAAYEDFGD